MRILRLKRYFLLVSVPFVSTLAMIGQSGSVRGSILDPSGAAVAGTHITLSGHGAARTTTSDASGDYQFSSLNPGSYTLTVEASGFGHYENSSIHVSRNDVLDWPVRLALQSASQSITVQGDADSLEQIPTVGKTGTMLEDIPQSISIISHQLSDSQGDLELADTVRNASGIIQGGTDGFGFLLKLTYPDGHFYNLGGGTAPEAAPAK